MNINNLTIKAQEVLQSAMNLARSDRNQAVEPLHMLDAIVAEDDSVGVFLLQKLGVNVGAAAQRAAAAGRATAQSRGRRGLLLARKLRGDPKSGRLHEDVRRQVRFGRASVARHTDRTQRGEPAAEGCRSDRKGAGRRNQRAAQRRDGRQPDQRAGVRRAGQVRDQPERAGTQRQARPGNRARRRDTPRIADTFPPDEKQPDSGRRAWRRQNGHRRRHRAPDRRRRRAGKPAQQAGLLARHGWR